MNTVLEVLELAERQAREGGAAVPEVVLRGVVRETGASGGTLGKGGDLLARWGAEGPADRHLELSAGRDAFWLELVGGSEPEPELRLAAGVALSSWMVREELKKARFAERRRLWEVESLRAIGEVLGGTLEPGRIAEALVLHATALLDARRGEVWLSEGSSWKATASVTGAQAAAPCDDDTCIIAARVGDAVLARQDVPTLPAGGLLEDGRLAVPIVGRRGRLGVVALAEREVRGGLAPFAATDLETLALFASQAAVALENASLHREDMERQLLRSDLELAASVQRELFPSSFVAPAGFEITGRSEPCRHVGGDVYDLLSAPQGVLMMVGDVAGKGVAAALMASSLQAALRVLGRGCPSVGELAQQLHAHLLSTTPENKFATVFLGCLHGDGTLDYVSAGHNPTILAAPDGRVELLGSSGPPLGLLSTVSYGARRAVLPPGGVLLAYTDGLSEAPAPDSGEEFGLQALVELAVRFRPAPLGALIEEVFAAVARHSGDLPPHDDRTLLAIRRQTV